MAVTYDDLMRIIPSGVDYWVNPEYAGSADLLSGLLNYYRPQDAPVGEIYRRAPNAGLFTRGFRPQLGVRAFAQDHGIEDLLNWDQENQRVTLGGYDVPYTFGMQGRTYAAPSDMYKILKQVEEEERKAVSKNKPASKSRSQPAAGSKRLRSMLGG